MFGLIFWSWSTTIVMAINNRDFSFKSFNFIFFITKTFSENILNYLVLFAFLTYWIRITPNRLNTFNISLFFGFIHIVKAMSLKFEIFI